MDDKRSREREAGCTFVDHREAGGTLVGRDDDGSVELI